MKTSDLLSIGAVALVGYFLFKQKQASAETLPAVQMQPLSNSDIVKSQNSEIVPTATEVKTATSVVQKAINDKSVTPSQKSYLQTVLSNPVSVSTIGRLKSVAVSPTSTYRISI
jgi:hypothetical protein